MTRPADPIDRRPTQVGSPTLEQIDSQPERGLLIDIERLPPVLELVGDLDLPHQPSMSTHDLVVKTTIELGEGALTAGARSSLL